MLTNLRRQFFCLNNVDRTTRASLLGFIGEVIIIRSFLIPVGRKSTTDMDEQVVSMMVQLLFKLGELAIESDLCCDRKLSEITANGLVGCMSSGRRVFKKDNPMTAAIIIWSSDVRASGRRIGLSSGTSHPADSLKNHLEALVFHPGIG